jgi:hypothetical protein
LLVQKILRWKIIPPKHLNYLLLICYSPI